MQAADNVRVTAGESVCLFKESEWSAEGRLTITFVTVFPEDTSLHVGAFPASLMIAYHTDWLDIVEFGSILALAAVIHVCMLGGLRDALLGGQ